MKTVKNALAALTLCFSICLPATADSFSFSDRAIPEFHEVSPGIYRGGHPKRMGLEKLRSLGVKTILSLENDEDAIYLERRQVREMGMDFLSMPLSRFWAPEDSEAQEILAAMSNPSLRPIFIHCTLGQDRTGLMVGLHRVYAEKVDPASAYAEMLENGFKRKFMVPMDRYFRGLTGFKGMRERD